MSALADGMARLLWWYVLWLMRKPQTKRFQKWLLRVFPVRLRPSVIATIKRQNKIARRWGLRVLIAVMNFVLASVLVTFFYLLALSLYEAGAFKVPRPSDSREPQVGHLLQASAHTQIMMDTE